VRFARTSGVATTEATTEASVIETRHRICALLPRRPVISLDFGDHPIEASKADHACGLCRARDSSTSTR